MKKLLLILFLACLVPVSFRQTARADASADTVGYEPFSPAELDDLLAPIALYPDPLLAQMFPAATFVDQIDEAARYVRQYGQGAQIDDQSWDISVRAVAHYPAVLFMMDRRYDWTVSLGQAFAYQEGDLMDSIQRLRKEALDAGGLVSGPRQQVIVDGDFISIVPVDPDTIYLPDYDAAAVYLEPPDDGGGITFSAGFVIGVWLNRDCDWRHRHIFYHGWRGGGWVGRSRLHIKPRDSVYVNERFNAVSVDPRVGRRSAGDFRDELRQGARNRPVRPAASPRGTVGRAPAARGPELSVPSGVRRQPAPENGDVYRGRDVQKSQPASRTGYGGYGTGGEATRYRERGQTSREIMQRTPAARPSAPSPSPRPSPPAGHGGGGGAIRQR